MKIGAVILAAGASQRFGTPKQLLPVDDKIMLQHVIDLVRSVGFAKSALVLGANINEILPQIAVDESLSVLQNHDWKLGQSSSVRIGVEFFEHDCDAIMFFLGDQPYITQKLVKREIEVYYERMPEILVPVFKGRRGNPVIFGRACYSDLKNVQGDQGGRAIFPAHQVFEMEWTNSLESRDIDTRNDVGG